MDGQHASSLPASQNKARRAGFNLDLLSNQPVKQEEVKRVRDMVYFWGDCSRLHKSIVRLILWGRGVMRRALVATLIILLVVAGVIITANRIPPAAGTALFIVAAVVVLVVAFLVYIWPRPPKE